MASPCFLLTPHSEGIQLPSCEDIKQSYVQVHMPSEVFSNIQDQPEVCGLPWEGILQPQSSLWMTAALADLLTS